MSKRLLVLITAVFAAFSLIAVTGCGSDKKDSGSGGSAGDTVEFDFAKAVKATKEKGSADLALTLNATSKGKTQSLAVTGKADFKNTKLDLSMDLAKLLADNGVPAGDGKVQVLIDGKKLWLHLPKVQGLNLPGGQQWISLDLQVLIDKFNLDDQAKKASGEPLPPVKMSTVGTETVNGVEVTHLKAEATLREIINGLPASEQQRKDAIANLEKQDGGKKALDETLPAEVWVDSSNALHRLKASIKVDDGKDPAQADIDLTFSNFGTPVTITPPSAGETFDATQFLESAADGIKDSVSKSLKTS